VGGRRKSGGREEEVRWEGVMIVMLFNKDNKKASLT
jgi:hypothetical protein